MKKNLLLISIFYLLFQINTKAQSYTFSHRTEAYADIPSPFILSTPGWDDFDQYSTFIPFQFELYGTPFNIIYIYSELVSFTSDFSEYGIAPYLYSSLIDNDLETATISYEIYGVAPYRIFKLQIKDATFFESVSGTDLVNYQLWLFETTNVVEIHYGSNTITDPQVWSVPLSTGPGVAISVNPSNGLSLDGPESNPTAYSWAPNVTIEGAPSDGMVYIFTPSITSVDETEKNKSFELFPNPNNGNFKIHKDHLTNEAEFSVFDLAGKKVYHINQLENSPTLNLSLAKGMYFAEIRDSDKVMRKSFVIE